MSARKNTLVWFGTPGQRVAVLAIIVCAVTFQLLVRYEPRGPQSCDDVQILGVESCGRGGKCFIVSYLKTSQRRHVGTFVDKPFAEDYIGLAALLMRKGEWMGSLHFEMKDSCNNQ